MGEGWFFICKKSVLMWGSAAKFTGSARFITDRPNGMLREFGAEYSLVSYLEKYVELCLRGGLNRR